MVRKNRVLVAAGLALGAAAPAIAQDSDVAPIQARLPKLVLPMSGGGVMDALGTVVGGPYNIQDPVPAPADNGCLGVAIGWGHLWIAGRGSTGTVAAHRIHKFTPGGVWVKSFAQNSASAAWGGRDGAANEAANLLYFGEETGRLTEYSYTPATGDIAFSRAINLGAVVGAATIVRALAFNPNNGHFYTANFSTSITEFTIDPPTLVGIQPNALGPAGGIGALYGLAYSDVTNTLWGFSQNNTAASIPAPGLHQVFAAEVSATTFATTGRTFDGAVVPNTGVAPDNLAGGVEIMCNHPGNPGKLSFVGVHQAAPDVVVVYDIEDACGSTCYPDCNLSGTLTLADFGCFQGKYVLGDMYADCNNSGTLSLADFGCFQSAYVLGCP